MKRLIGLRNYFLNTVILNFGREAEVKDLFKVTTSFFCIVKPEIIQSRSFASVSRLTLRMTFVYMKPIFKTLLKYYLKYITKLVLAVHRPTIIAVAGSTNKTFVKDEIKKVLEKKGYSVRANQNNFNTEIGLPLAVLNLPSGYNSYKKWLPCLYQSIFAILARNFPKILVLELGASSRGDMKHLLSIIKPKISILTDITQRYLENFSDMNDLTDEYKILAEKTNHGGQVIINCDNIKLKKIYDGVKGKKQSFGFSSGCGWRISDCQKTEKGENFKIKHGDSILEKEVDRFGEHHIYAGTVGLIINEIF